MGVSLYKMFAKILSEINQPYYKENFPNDGQRFVAWYLRNIHNLDTHETKDCITDVQGTSRSMLFISTTSRVQSLLYRENFMAGIR